MEKVLNQNNLKGYLHYKIITSPNEYNEYTSLENKEVAPQLSQFKVMLATFLLVCF